jgi:S-disulfanyl-L-cysteine oxidoreductase SoxD
MQCCNNQFKIQNAQFKMVLALAFCLLNFELRVFAQGPTYHLGRPASDAELAKSNVGIAPDGEGLPPGSGTAEKGKPIYEAQCARCHGATGREGPEDVLVGGTGTLATAKPQRTVGSFWPYATTVWDYVNRAMPFDRPGIMPPDDVYAVVAYVLHLNGLVSATEPLDARTLPKVRMPNRDGFVPDDRDREPFRSARPRRKP